MSVSQNESKGREIRFDFTLLLRVQTFVVVIRKIVSFDSTIEI